MAKHGTLLVFEGPDGVGKSTLVKETEKILALRGVQYEALSFPGKDPGTVGWVVDQIHHNPALFNVTALTPLSLQALHIAAHLDHIESRILPALERGTWFVLDRYWWSTWVYGTAARVNSRVLDKLVEAEQAAWELTLPAMVVLVRRTSAFRPEQTEGKFLELVNLYDELAQRASKQHPVVSIANDDLESSITTIQKHIGRLLDP
jgi:thymidylate kinase